MRLLTTSGVRSNNAIYGDVDSAMEDASFRTVEVVDVSLQTTLPFDDDEGDNEANDVFSSEGVSSCNKSGVVISSSGSPNSSSLLNESSYRQVEVVDASMQADFSLEFPAENPSPTASPYETRESSFDSLSLRAPRAKREMQAKQEMQASDSQILLPKPFVPYFSPNGSPSLFGPREAPSTSNPAGRTC